MNKKIISTIMIISVFLLSTSAIFVKLAAAPSSIIAFYRLFFTTIILLPFVLKGNRYINEFKNLHPKDILIGFLSGIFLSSHYLFWFESLNYTSVTSSTVIATMQPIYSIIGGYILFKERYKFKTFIFIAIAIFGSFLIGLSDFELGKEALFGDLLALISAIIITIYFLIGQHLRKKLSAIPYSIMGYLSSSIILFIYSYMKDYSFFGFTTETWFCFLGLAVLSTIFGQLILNWLLKWVNATTISMGILIEPVFASILAVVIVRESLQIKQLIGMSIVLLGLYLFIKSNTEFKKI